ncbi:Thiazole synthase [Frankliniella fusca]|uniref:Thiazole synthase n=1 Tax=Frankliniella fusca TaxID=407009 RepID=A0AAE1LF73_9NEOP|nr:Thiazole synthase [Frankliniella fusca]
MLWWLAVRIPDGENQERALLQAQQSQQAEQSMVNDDDETSYLQDLGIDFTQTTQPGSALSANPTSSNGRQTVYASSKRQKVQNKENTSPQQQPNTSRSRDPDSVANEVFGSYEEQCLLQRKRNLQFPRDNNIIAPRSKVPKVKKRKTPANKKATSGQIRKMPDRKAKNRNSETVLKNVEEEEEEDVCDVDMLTEVHVESQSTPTNDVPLTSAETASKPVEKPNLIGERLTRCMPLSPLPTLFENELKSGKFDIRKVSSFLIEHCKNIVGRDPQRGEYGILAEQFTNKMTCLGILNAQSYQKRIQLSLSSSVRAKKRWVEGLKQLRQEKKKNKEVQLEINPNLCAAENTEEVTADARLRRPVLDKNAVKRAIISSVERIHYFKTNSVKQSMATYPYLHHCDLMIFEYATRVPIQEEDLESNFHKSVVPLAAILGKEETHSELLKLEVFQEMNNFFADDSAVVHPLLQIWDTSVKVISPLNNLPKGQAPTIVVLKAAGELQSVHLTFDGEKLASLTKPTAFQCIALLMSAYYVFDCEFPSAFVNSLSVMAAILHGTIDSSLKACGDKCRRRLELLQKLSVALMSAN